MDRSRGRESSQQVRTRPRFSRTFSRGRWTEYRSLLRQAISHGYALVPLERFFDNAAVRGGDRVLILRHDVDQRPRAALELAATERELGVQSTWYFRWRTADVDVVEAVRAQGGEVGLHYETLTRSALAEGLRPGAEGPELLARCRALLQDELAAFRALFGPTRSVAAHGDSRVPWLRNLDLLESGGPEAVGAEYDANITIRRHRLGSWLTDRSSAEGSWGGDQPPEDLFAAGVSPILCLTHPNNWVSGPALLRDRFLVAALPDRRAGRAARVGRPLPDDPPTLAQVKTAQLDR